MIDLINEPGIGLVTMEKCFRFIMRGDSQNHYLIKSRVRPHESLKPQPAHKHVFMQWLTHKANLLRIMVLRPF